MVQSDEHSFCYRSNSHKSLFLVSTFIVVTCWLFIIFLSRQPGQWALHQFLFAAALMLALTAVVVWQFHRARRKIPFTWIILTALLLRLISLYGDPLFEDDYYRYMWDGYQTVTTMDPYTLAPSKFFDRDDFPESFESILSLINYPEIATVYGPVTQWIFGLGYLIEPAAVWPLQLLAGLADVLLIVVLYRLGAGNALLLYAWSPLILKEFALTAHPDIYAMLAVILGLFSVSKKQVWLTGVFLALAVGSKVFAVLIFPYLLTRRWSIRYWVTLCSWFVFTIGFITAVFGSLNIWVPDGLQAMADSWLFNSAVYLLLLEVLSFQTIKVMLPGCFAFGVIIACISRQMSARHNALNQNSIVDALNPLTSWSDSKSSFRGDWVFMAFLLALPVVNPWYIAWFLPFATLFPRWWSWTLSYSCLLSYWIGSNTGVTGANSLELPMAIILVEYAAMLLTTLFAWIGCRRHQHYREFASL